jgi:hypothetical protein
MFQVGATGKEEEEEEEEEEEVLENLSITYDLCFSFFQHNITHICYQ